MNSQLSAIDRVVSSLMAYQPEKIILFGSMARGDADEYSDIDLIVIKETKQRFVRRLVEINAFIPLDIGVDVLIYTPTELETMLAEGNPFIEKALEEGKVLYEKPPGNG